MIYPWMFGTGPVLRPLRAAAEELAAREHWPRLHDAPLAASGAPPAAAVYYEDMYVPVQFSMPTARAIAGLRPWITNKYQHGRPAGQQRHGPRPAHRAGPSRRLTPPYSTCQVRSSFRMRPPSGRSTRAPAPVLDTRGGPDQAR